MDMIRFLSVALALAALPEAAKSHEFWIDPVEFQVAVGAPIVADIRVGQEYDGAAYSYLPRNFRRFDLATGDDVVPVEGRIGDRPAMTQTADDGLAVVVHVTTDNRLTYKDMVKFENFVTHKDALWTLDIHADKGLPTTDFLEMYSRYAKSLVAVGSGEGSDREVGLETEIVALKNPYTEALGDILPVRVLYQGAPRADTQVEIFEKAADNSVVVNTVQTDADGIALVPVKAGHRYMLDAVVLREPSAELAEETGAIWESLWANLTFEVPS